MLAATVHCYRICDRIRLSRLSKLESTISREYGQLTIAVHFMHIFLGDPADYTLFNNLRILPTNMFNDLQIFHGYLIHVSLWFLCYALETY
jgi:hypothetical protein